VFNPSRDNRTPKTSMRPSCEWRKRLIHCHPLNDRQNGALRRTIHDISSLDPGTGHPVLLRFVTQWQIAAECPTQSPIVTTNVSVIWSANDRSGQVCFPISGLSGHQNQSRSILSSRKCQPYSGRSVGVFTTSTTRLPQTWSKPGRPHQNMDVMDWKLVGSVN
jgi:hypothetical protein